MSAYSNVVGGKLKLKGKALDVRAGGMKKKKKETQQEQVRLQLLAGQAPPAEGEAKNLSGEAGKEEAEELEEEEGREGRQQAGAPCVDHRTAAEKKYHEQKAKLEAQRLVKVASKSHRQRVEEFNQYLANLSEHYDIPKVGPG